MKNLISKFTNTTGIAKSNSNSMRIKQSRYKVGMRITFAIAALFMFCGTFISTNHINAGAAFATKIGRAHV